MTTKGFIKKVHDIFDELNYHETRQLSFDCFKQSVVRTLTHCKDLSDAINTVRMCKFCLKRWQKIEKVFKRKLTLYNEYASEGSSLISTVTDNEALGTYFITNGINCIIKEIFVVSHSFGDNILTIGYRGGKFAFTQHGNYYIKYAKMSAAKMKLFDNKGKCLCNIVLSENAGIFLENNKTPFDLILYDDYIGIYERRYLNSLSWNDIIDTNKLTADIEWDILEKKSDFGLAKLCVYATNEDFELAKSNCPAINQDLEIYLLLASATFLVCQRYIKAQKNHNVKNSFFGWSFWYQSNNIRR